MSGIQIPNSELVVCSRLCIMYFVHSFPLNHSLLYWQSRYAFKISKHNALPNPIWPFHSYRCISEPDPTNLLHGSTEQTPAKKLFTHSWGFFGEFCDSSTLQYLSWCRCHHPSGPGFLSAMGKKMKYQRPRENLAWMALQEGTDVEETFSCLQPQKRWGRDDLLQERPHCAMHRRDTATIY